MLSSLLLDFQRKHPRSPVLTCVLACLRSRQARRRRLEYSGARRIAGCEAKRRGAR
jgi:hypothetical protein